MAGRVPRTRATGAEAAKPAPQIDGWATGCFSDNNVVSAEFGLTEGFGELAYLDDGIGRLLAGLTEQGLLERTLVVVTSDHGENLADQLPDVVSRIRALLDP